MKLRVWIEEIKELRSEREEPLLSCCVGATGGAFRKGADGTTPNNRGLLEEVWGSERDAVLLLGEKP